MTKKIVFALAVILINVKLVSAQTLSIVLDDWRKRFDDCR